MAMAGSPNPKTTNDEEYIVVGIIFNGKKNGMEYQEQ